MTCPNCGLHSFVIFGKINDVNLVYSSTAKSKETPQDLTIYKKHFAAIKGRWLWFIDFDGMQAKHYTSISFTRELVDLITNEQLDRLDGMYIINPNGWIRMTMKTMSAMLPKNFREKLRLFETSGTGLLLEIERSGIDRPNVLSLLEQLRSKT